MPFDPATLLQGASILTRGMSGGPSSAAARTDTSWVSLWSSPFQVGDGGNSATTSQDATPTVGGGGGSDLWGVVIPLVAVAGAVALGIAIVKSGK